MPLLVQSEDEIPKGLELPKGQIIPSDDDTSEFILFTMEEYRKIVHMYNGYVLYDNNRKYISNLKFIDIKLEKVKTERLTLCLEAKEDMKIQVADVFDIWKEEHKLRLNENSKNKVSGVLVGLGAGVGGLILGAAVGIIWATASQ